MRREPPVVEQCILDYIQSRWPERASDIEELGSKYGTAYARLIHVKIINGALRDLGMGTGNSEPREKTVKFEDTWVTIGWVDVVGALKGNPGSFKVWRSNLRLANRLYQWMEGHRRDWMSTTPQGREHEEFFEALKTFFGPERLPALTDATTLHSGASSSSAHSPLALQRARGWAATAMHDEVQDVIRKLHVPRAKLPPSWPLCD